MALLLSLATSTSAQAATFPATFKFINYASVGQNNVWCSGTDAGIVMRCAVQNWAGSAYIVNSCVETSRYIAPGSLGIGGNTYGGNVYGTCNVHTISPPQDWIFQVSERSVVWVALQNIHVCSTGSTWTGDATYQCSCNAGYKLDAAGTSCVPVVTCPANSSRSDLYPYQCTCNTGYKFDAVGGICVPLRECTIPDLPAITDPEVQLFEDNPNRADTARLTSRMQTALTCLKTAAVAGSPSTGSAYRPPAYNQHLIDVWNKWDAFETDINYDLQDCAARKEKIRLHFKAHGLLESQTPVPGSLHTKGEAVDVTINLPAANIDALAAGCHLRRPKPVKDKVHFIYQ